MIVKIRVSIFGFSRTENKKKWCLFDLVSKISNSNKEVGLWCERESE